MVRKDLNSPRRELSNGGLKSVATLLVRWQINYSCASTGSTIQLYQRSVAGNINSSDRNKRTAENNIKNLELQEKNLNSFKYLLWSPKKNQPV